MKKPAVVKTDENSPATEVLSQAIVGISDSMKKMRRGTLAPRALYVLIRDNYRSSIKYKTAKPSIREIKAVLDSVESLRDTYVR